MAVPEDEKDKQVKTTPAQGATPDDAREFSEAVTELDLKLRPLSERYTLLAELGRGGMGIVYKARDRETGDLVALKALHAEIAARPDLIERFKSELLLARKVTHKNVCRTHELLRFGDTVVIAMEYVEGESLRSLLNRVEGLSLRQGLKILRQVLAGLAEAHARGVVHRDLKPENVMLDRAGQVKVMDFGIARSLETRATQTGAVSGTPAYMSPEQAEGKPADARSDIYALGLILYEMFTGQQAFTGDTPVALALKQIHETPPPPSAVEPYLPGFLDRAIQKCLEKDPKKRFPSVDELEAALTAKPAPVPGAVGVEEVPLPLHLTRWQRSDWLLVAAAVAGLALFFPFFERTSLAPRSKVSFDRSVLRRIGEEYVQRLGAPLGKERRIAVVQFAPRYDYVAKTAGAQAALEITSNPVPYWEWYVEWQHETEGETNVFVDNRGVLLVIWREFRSAPSRPILSVEEVRPLAEKALRDFYHRDPGSLNLEHAGSDTLRGYATTSFIWVDPNEYHGLKQRYTVRFVGREIAFLSSRYQLPDGYNWRQPTRWGPPVLLALGAVLLIVGFAQRRRVELGVRWRKWMAVLAFGLGGFIGWDLVSVPNLPPHLITSTAFGVLFVLVWLFASVAIEQSIRKVAPARLTSFVRMFDRSVASEPCGLAILRGALLGLALLGVDTFLVWVGTNRLGMWLDSEAHIGMQNQWLASPWPIVWTAVVALLQTLGFGFFLIPFLVYLATRLLRRNWLAALLAAAMAAASDLHVSMAAVQPAHWMVVLLFLHYLVLVWAFTRYGVLTLLAAIFTFGFCWQNYRMLVMHEPTGALQEWIAFAVWGVVVLAAAAIAFKTPLGAARRRLAAAFE